MFSSVASFQFVEIVFVYVCLFPWSDILRSTFS